MQLFEGPQNLEGLAPETIAKKRAYEDARPTFSSQSYPRGMKEWVSYDVWAVYFVLFSCSSLFLFLLFFYSIIYNDGETILGENEPAKSFDR